MKKANRVLTFIMSFVMCVSLLNIYVFAIVDADTQIEKGNIRRDESEEEVEPLAVAHCGRYATHDMLARGTGALYHYYNKKFVFTNGRCFQCTRCYLVLVTQSQYAGPPDYAPIGIYATDEPGYQISNYGAVVSKGSKDMRYTSKSTLDGISFRSQPYM